MVLPGDDHVAVKDPVIEGRRDGWQYFDLPADRSVLTVAIEKDLECVDGPPEEKDPEAFPRAIEKAC